MSSLGFNHISFPPPKTFKRSQKSKKARCGGSEKFCEKGSKKSRRGGGGAVRHLNHKSFPQTDRMCPTFAQFQPPIVLPSNRRGFSLFAKKISLIWDPTRFPALCAFYHKISYFGGVLLLTASHIKYKDGSNDVLVVRNRLTSSNKTNPIAATRPLISQTRPWGLFCVLKY